MSVEYLNSVPLFIDLDEEELSAVSQSCTPRKASADPYGCFVTPGGAHA